MSFRNPIHRPLASLLPSLAMLVFLACAAIAQAQTTAVAKAVRSDSTAEVTSLCNPQKTRSSSRGGQLSYVCEGKQPTPRPASATLKAAVGGGVRSEIICKYKEAGGEKTWLGCTCSADEDSNCTDFITWCAEQGDEVGGNSGSATCAPGG